MPRVVREARAVREMLIIYSTVSKATLAALSATRPLKPIPSPRHTHLSAESLVGGPARVESHLSENLRSGPSQLQQCSRSAPHIVDLSLDAIHHLTPLVQSSHSSLAADGRDFHSSCFAAAAAVANKFFKSMEANQSRSSSSQSSSH